MIEPMYELHITCMMCKKDQTVTVTASEIAELDRRFVTGKFVQDILPNHPASEGELFISQVCGDCFDKLYPEKEE